MDIQVLSVECTIQNLTDGRQRFDVSKPVIVLSGPNNSGKTILAQKIGRIVADPVAEDVEAIASVYLDRKCIGGSGENRLVSNQHDGAIYASTSLPVTHKFILVKDMQALGPFAGTFSEIINQKGSNVSTSLDKYRERSQFKWLSAERSINTASPKEEILLGESCIDLASDIEFCTNHRNGDPEVVRSIVHDLKSVYGNSIELSDLHSPRENNSLKLAFYSQQYGRQEIVKFGSGIRNVLMILSSIRIAEHLHQLKNKEHIIKSDIVGKTVLFIDEPELFMHASMLRKLCEHIEVMSGGWLQIILATHSPVVLDFFSKSEKAIMYHLRKTAAGVKVVEWSEKEHAAVLEALGNRPGELLSANAVLWVEGPSERILFRKAIDRISNGRLHEDLHYKIALYAGSLLHSYLKPNNDVLALADTLGRFNERFLVVSDSDRKTKGGSEGPIAQVLRRAAVDDMNRVFIGERRTLENYYPQRVLKSLYPGVFNDEFDWEFASVKDKLKDGGKTIEKVPLALNVLKEMNDEDWKGFFETDLGQHLDAVVEQIARWNDMRLEPAEEKKHSPNSLSVIP